MSEPTPIAYVNGTFLPLSEARVSILDRGFQFADGVYEVIPVYGGRPFRLDAHLGRLERSLREIGMAPPMDREALGEQVRELIARNEGRDCQAYIQVTRGEAPRNHPFPDAVHPTVVMTCTPVTPVPEEWIREGVSVITAEDIRWARCDIKSIALLPNVMMRQKAAESGAFEALWVHQGQVMEGAASNIFAVFGGRAVTPPDGSRVLPGITRDVVLELAAEQDLPVASGEIDAADLPHAEEIWVTSSTKEVLPVTRLDGEPVGKGRPGPLFRTVLDAYRARIRELRARAEEEQP
ncbi:cytochrome C [Thiohalorhabdus denitrificans]|uniref:Aminodeoxychorismate lyase n=1 Tax=Thiohalorhabdus denitrificans TaxID=381306 RepID=A0A0P9C6C4_9GAMM|nr:D-amino acid aminotransferase [Thiohalorhabdus denitrificans]KPV40656.1 cytochrome C [Thiohalorhabdus denitrificans]SCY48051.1 D-alanine transaminase [Thiohalorhabdus denitrificans]